MHRWRRVNVAHRWRHRRVKSGRKFPPISIFRTGISRMRIIAVINNFSDLQQTSNNINNVAALPDEGNLFSPPMAPSALVEENSGRMQSWNIFFLFFYFGFILKFHFQILRLSTEYFIECDPNQIKSNQIKDGGSGFFFFNMGKWELWNHSGDIYRLKRPVSLSSGGKKKKNLDSNNVAISRSSSSFFIQFPFLSFPLLSDFYFCILNKEKEKEKKKKETILCPFFFRFGFNRFPSTGHSYSNVIHPTFTLSGKASPLVRAN